MPGGQNQSRALNLCLIAPVLPWGIKPHKVINHTLTNILNAAPATTHQTYKTRYSGQEWDYHGAKKKKKNLGGSTTSAFARHPFSWCHTLPAFIYKTRTSCIESWEQHAASWLDHIRLEQLLAIEVAVALSSLFQPLSACRIWDLFGFRHRYLEMLSPLQQHLLQSVCTVSHELQLPSVAADDEPSATMRGDYTRGQISVEMKGKLRAHGSTWQCF